jgi:hypothetical protein
MHVYFVNYIVYSTTFFKIKYKKPNNSEINHGHNLTVPVGCNDKVTYLLR